MTRRMIHHRDCKAGRGGGVCSCWNQEAPVRRTPLESCLWCGAQFVSLVALTYHRLECPHRPPSTYPMTEPPPPAVAPTPRQDEAADCPLSAREVEVLQAMADHDTKEAVGKAIGIKAYTVKSHLGRIYARLGVGTIQQAVAMGFRKGWIK